MSDQPPPAAVPESYGQLTQVRVPLEDAAYAFMTRDESGRLPILVMPQRTSRVQTNLIWAALILLLGSWLANARVGNGWLLPIAIVLAIGLIILAVYRSFLVVVPEGVNALLARGGRHLRTSGSGTQILPPYIVVSHLVTRREIPFEIPVIEALTLDSVRANVIALVTFVIADPFKFVFSISADDFDRVLQAECQDALRRLIRSITVQQLIDLQPSEVGALQERISSDFEPFGVRIYRIVVTSIQPPLEFVRSHEARQLAVLMRAEQFERQALEQQRQADAAELASRRITAEAASESLRLQQLEERLQRFPAAAQYDMQVSRLQVMRELAGNSRAMLQIRNIDDLTQTTVLRDMAPEKTVVATNGSDVAQETTVFATNGSDELPADDRMA
jgi:regulator of protease activity HflC (stomatin/prohibitin superfamily)